MYKYLNNIGRLLKRGVFRQTAYISDRLYTLREATLLPHAKEHAVAPILIVGRGLYQEKIEWYPITKKADVLRLVTLQRQQYQGYLGYQIGDPVNDKTPVTYYYMGEHKAFQKAWLILPETALINSTLQPKELVSYPVVEQQNNSRQVYLAQTEYGGASAIQGGVLRGVEQFAHAQGFAYQSVTVLDRAETLARLTTGLTRPDRFRLRGFWHKSAMQRTAKQLHVVRIGSVAVVSFTLYLLIMNTAVSWWTDYQQQRLTILNQEARQVSSIQQQIDDMTGQYQQRLTQLSVGHNPLQVWEALTPLLGNVMTVTQIQWRNESYSMQIEADSATRALQAILDRPGVLHAEFQSPVRRQRGREIASIRLDLDTTGASHE